MLFAVRPGRDPEGGVFRPWDRRPYAPSPECAPGRAPERRPVARIELTAAAGRRITAVYAECAASSEMEALAGTLASLLGVRAEVADQSILIHGDHRERLRRELKRKGYRVKG